MGRNPERKLTPKPKAKPATPKPAQAGERRLVVHQQHYMGPLPPPHIVREHSETYPAAAKIIFDDFQARTKHIRSLEAQHQEVQKKKSL